MKKFILVYAPRIQKDLRALDHSIAKRIVAKLEKYIEAPDPLTEAKALSGKLHGFLSVSSWRLSYYF